MPIPARKELYSLADILAWDVDEHMELINGQAFMLATPSRLHQEVCFEIGRQIGNYLVGKQCKVYLAPFGVRLFERDGDRPEDVDTMVEPDICVVCDRSKLDRHGCRGAPDMIVEVLSPSTQRLDQLVKLNLYQRAGVREYWIADPVNKTVRVLLRADDGSLRTHEIYRQEDVARVCVLEGCFVELGRVFGEG